MNKLCKALLCFLISTSLLNVTAAVSSNSNRSDADSSEVIDSARSTPRDSSVDSARGTLYDSEASDSPRGTVHDTKELIFTDKDRCNALLLNPEKIYDGKEVRTKITDTAWATLARINSMDLTLYPTQWVMENVKSLLDLLASVKEVYISNPFLLCGSLSEDFDKLLPGLSVRLSNGKKVLRFDALGPKSLIRHIGYFLQHTQDLSSKACSDFLDTLRKRVHVNAIIDKYLDAKDGSAGHLETKGKSIAAQLSPLGIILSEDQRPCKLYEGEAAWIWLEKTTELFYKDTKGHNDGNPAPMNSAFLWKLVSMKKPPTAIHDSTKDFNEKVLLLSETLLIPPVKIDLVIKNFGLTLGNSLRDHERASYIRYLSSQNGDSLLSIGDMNVENGVDLTSYTHSWVMENMHSLGYSLARVQDVYINHPFVSNESLPADFDNLLPGLTVVVRNGRKVLRFNTLGQRSPIQNISFFLQFTQNLSPMAYPVFFNTLRKRIQVNELIDKNPDVQLAEQLLRFGIILKEGQQPYKVYDKDAAWIWLEKTTELFYTDTKPAIEAKAKRKNSVFLQRRVFKTKPQAEEDQDKAMTDFNEKVALLSATLLIPSVKIDLVIKTFGLTFGNSLRNLERIGWIKHLSNQSGDTLLSIENMGDEIRKKMGHGLSCQARMEELNELLKSTPRTRRKNVERSVKASGSRKLSWRRSMEKKEATIEPVAESVAETDDETKSRSRAYSFTLPDKDALISIARRQSTGSISMDHLKQDSVAKK